MPEWFNLLVSDIRFSIAHISASDIITAASCAVWGMLWLFPLKGIDRRDHFAGIDFICFLCFAAVVLFYALPQAFFPQPIDWHGVSLSLGLVMLLGTVRWYVYPRKHPATAKVEAKKGNTRG